jgi:prepilin peptidase CpaA
VLGLVWPAGLSENPAPILQWGGAIAASLIGAFSDLRSRRIPNLLTGPALLGGLALAAILGGWSALGESVCATLVLALPYVLLFLFAGGGAGDAKLMGAIGSWLGLQWGLAALFGVAASGVVLALLFALFRGRFSKVVAGVTWATVGLLHLAIGNRPMKEGRTYFPTVEDSEKMPYGLAILTGTLLAAGITWTWTAR